MCDRRNCRIGRLSTKICAKRLRKGRKFCKKLNESSDSVKRFVEEGFSLKTPGLLCRGRLLNPPLMFPGAFEGRKAEATLMSSDGKS